MLHRQVEKQGSKNRVYMAGQANRTAPILLLVYHEKSQGIYTNGGDKVNLHERSPPLRAIVIRFKLFYFKAGFCSG